MLQRHQIIYEMWPVFIGAHLNVLSWKVDLSRLGATIGGQDRRSYGTETLISCDADC